MRPNLHRLSSARERAIAGLAEDVLAEHCPEGWIDPEEIARRLGLAFSYLYLPEGLNGGLGIGRHSYVILLNASRAARHSGRSRYTFAHELGHYFLHREQLAKGKFAAQLSDDHDRSTDAEEREADCFAAHLLLPPRRVQRAIGDSGQSGLGIAIFLAEAFGVSVTAAAYRALDLGFFAAPAALFRWTRQGEPVGRRLSRETLRLGERLHVLAKLPPPESATADAIALGLGAPSARPTRFPLWFPALSNYDNEYHRDAQEEVMSLGEHGWLTLIHAGSLA